MLHLPSEYVIVAATVDAANKNNSTTNMSSIDMMKFHQALFVVDVGSCDNTVDFKLQGSVDGSTNWTDLSGKSIATINATSNKQALVNLRSSELLAGGYRYARGVLTVGNGTTNQVAVVGLGVMPRFEPANDDKASSVTQIVN